MDDEILNTVHSLFGKSVQIVDCEKTSSVCHEEELLINGIPVQLEGSDGDAIKNALLTGNAPSVELLNQLLYQAGILRQNVQLETSLSVKSSMVAIEEVSVERDGRILDERKSETKEDYSYQSSKNEIWEPTTVPSTTAAATEAECVAKCIGTHHHHLDNSQSKHTSTSCSSTTIPPSASSWSKHNEMPHRQLPSNCDCNDGEIPSKNLNITDEETIRLPPPLPRRRRNINCSQHQHHSVTNQETETNKIDELMQFIDINRDMNLIMKNNDEETSCRKHSSSFDSNISGKSDMSTFKSASKSSTACAAVFDSEKQKRFDVMTQKKSPNCHHHQRSSYDSCGGILNQNTNVDSFDETDFLTSSGCSINVTGNNKITTNKPPSTGINFERQTLINYCGNDTDHTDTLNDFDDSTIDDEHKNGLILKRFTIANQNSSLQQNVKNCCYPSLSVDEKTLMSSDSGSGNRGLSTSPPRSVVVPLQQITRPPESLGVGRATVTTTTINASANNAKELSSSGTVVAHKRDDSFNNMCYDRGISTAVTHHCQYVKPQTLLPKIALEDKANSCSIRKNDDNNDDDAAAAAAAAALTKNQQHLLMYRDGNLISGSLDALIQHMVPTSDYYPENSFIFSFLLSARLFIRPHELLARISEIWQAQQNLIESTNTPSSYQSVTLDFVDNSKTNIDCGSMRSPKQQQQQQQIYHSSNVFPIKNKEQQANVSSLSNFSIDADLKRVAAVKSAQNCIRLLAEWIDTFPYDFRDERLMQQVKLLARKCVCIDKSLGRTVSKFLQSLVHRLTTLEKYEKFLQNLNSTTINSSATDETFETTAAAAVAKNDTQMEISHLSDANVITSACKASSSSSINSSNATAFAASYNHHLLAHNTAIGKANVSSALSQQLQQHKQQRNSNAGNLSISHNSTGTYSYADQLQQSVGCSGNSLSSLGLSGNNNNCAGNSNAHDATVSSCSDINFGIMDLCGDPELLAHQLTNIELERLSHIGPEEFVQAFAKDNQLESFNDMKKTRNLESYIQWFNRLSYLTATEIVKHSKKKHRVRVIEFWIETARECFNNGNFNSLMAIIAGLNLSPISRLKKTWSKVQSAKFSVLEHQMDPTSNFNSYRSTLKAAMWRFEGATNERERIIIPFFSLLVKDLYFLNEGCSNRLPNGHINFEKFWQLAKQVMEFNTWKKVICPFEKIPKAIMFLQNTLVLNENTLSMASFECEPPENNQEKGRYKTLKSENKHQQ